VYTLLSLAPLASVSYTFRSLARPPPRPKNSSEFVLLSAPFVELCDGRRRSAGPSLPSSVGLKLPVHPPGPELSPAKNARFASPLSLFFAAPQSLSPQLSSAQLFPLSVSDGGVFKESATPRHSSSYSNCLGLRQTGLQQKKLALRPSTIMVYRRGSSHHASSSPSRASITLLLNIIARTKTIHVSADESSWNLPFPEREREREKGG